MNEKIGPDDTGDIFAGLEPPAPAPGLAARTISAAAAVLTREPRDAWSRLWHSRPLRLAWAATVAVLLFGHLALSPQTAKLRRTAAPVASSLLALDEELLQIVSLPRIAEAALGSIPAVGNGGTDQDRTGGPS